MTRLPLLSVDKLPANLRVGDNGTTVCFTTLKR